LPDGADLRDGPRRLRRDARLRQLSEWPDLYQWAVRECLRRDQLCQRLLRQQRHLPDRDERHRLRQRRGLEPGCLERGQGRAQVQRVVGPAKRQRLDCYQLPAAVAYPVRPDVPAVGAAERELAIPARRVVRNETLYLASAADLLKVVQATGPRVTHLLLVAHNPGLSELLQLQRRDTPIDCFVLSQQDAPRSGAHRIGADPGLGGVGRLNAVQRAYDPEVRRTRDQETHVQVNVTSVDSVGVRGGHATGSAGCGGRARLLTGGRQRVGRRWLNVCGGSRRISGERGPLGKR